MFNIYGGTNYYNRYKRFIILNLKRFDYYLKFQIILISPTNEFGAYPLTYELEIFKAFLVIDEIISTIITYFTNDSSFTSGFL